jgi:predicted ATPase
MRIISIRLQNFKRFTDLTIRDIPDSAKLVVIVGPNGCGKSSVFDAILHWYRSRTSFGIDNDDNYFRKDKAEPYDWQRVVEITLAGGVDPKRGGLYVRTAYRNDPDFTIGSISRMDAPSDGLRIGRTIQNDQTVAENYQRLVLQTMAGVYDVANNQKSVALLRDELIGGIRDSMKRVFDDLVLNDISDPLGSGSFFFEKGTTKSYHYKNLSGGEKAAFDLLLDLHIKKKFYTNSIYCIDEIETHLHTRAQGKLLREITRIIPGLSQLWVTTHSLGVLRSAQELAIQDPGSVSLIDFEALAPDEPRQITPSNLGRVTWEKMLSIALDDLSRRIAPRAVVTCEGSSVGTRRKDFDAEIYNRILGSQTPDVLFVSGGSSNQVAQNGLVIRHTLASILPTAKVVALCDRDDKSDTEVELFEREGGLVLPERNLESFLFADDVIEALVVQSGNVTILNDALQLKRDEIAESVTRGNPEDDLKSAAGRIYVRLRQLLGLQRCGNSVEAFMRDTLAPLIVPPMQTYSALKSAVIDRV